MHREREGASKETLGYMHGTGGLRQPPPVCSEWTWGIDGNHKTKGWDGRKEQVKGGDRCMRLMTSKEENLLHSFLKMYQYITHRSDIYHRHSNIYAHIKCTHVWIHKEMNMSYILKEILDLLSA